MDYSKYVGKRIKLFNQYSYVEGILTVDGDIQIESCNFGHHDYFRARSTGFWGLRWSERFISPNLRAFENHGFFISIDGKVIYASNDDIFEACKLLEVAELGV